MRYLKDMQDLTATMEQLCELETWQKGTSQKLHSLKAFIQFELHNADKGITEDQAERLDKLATNLEKSLGGYKDFLISLDK